MKYKMKGNRLIAQDYRYHVVQWDSRSRHKNTKFMRLSFFGASVGAIVERVASSSNFKDCTSSWVKCLVCEW